MLDGEIRTGNRRQRAAGHPPVVNIEAANSIEAAVPSDIKEWRRMEQKRCRHAPDLRRRTRSCDDDAVANLASVCENLKATLGPTTDRRNRNLPLGLTSRRRPWDADCPTRRRHQE
jgi:hypothetical protein